MADYIYTNNSLINTAELRHYGVIGMKWGVKRARRLEAASARAKKRGMTTRADKLAVKAKKQKAATERVRKEAAEIYGRKAVDRAANQSDAKNYVKTLLLGGYGSMKYNQYVSAKGTSRGKAVCKAMRDITINKLTLGRKAYNEEWQL